MSTPPRSTNGTERQTTSSPVPHPPAQRGSAQTDQARALFLTWCAGDERALDALVRLLTPMLWHLARSYRVDQAEAEDAVQNTWLALVTHRSSIQDAQALVRWLSVTVRREAARQAQRSDRVTIVEDTEVDLRLPVVAGPEDDAIRGAQAHALWSKTMELSSRCQHLLRILAFSDRPDYQSISTELSIPVGSIGPTRGRCLDKLRKACAADPAWSWS